MIGAISPEIQAAIGSKVSTEPGALELLSMPEQNREAVLFSMKNQSKLGQELMAFAFDTKQSMPIRWKALTLGALAKGAEAKVDLEKALKSEAWYMRNASLLAMERVFPQEAKSAAKALLQDKALVVRSAAVKVLSSALDAGAREALWDELDKPRNFKNKESLWIRGQIIGALARDPDKRELPIFAKALKDKDSRLHFYSILALEKISNKKLGTLHSSLAEKRSLWLKASL